MPNNSDVPDSRAVRYVHPDEVAAVHERLAGAAEIDRATAVFALLADPTRARILHALSLVPRLCVCDVAASLGRASRPSATSCGCCESAGSYPAPGRAESTTTAWLMSTCGTY